MIISIFNGSNGRISDELMQRAIRAINIQVERDFEPYWSFGATLRLEGHTQRGRGHPHAKHYDPLDMRGDALIYVMDHMPEGYEGVHDKNFRGVPWGVVGLDVSDTLQEEWSVTLSHEALELIGDPQANLLVQGPHPEHPSRDVFHWFEMCDAVQDQEYKIGDVAVSDFVLPLYFTPGAEPGGRNNFLGSIEGHAPLASFGVAHGGYIGFFDPHLGKDTEYYAPDDARAKARSAAKAKAHMGRRFRRAHRSRSRNLAAAAIAAHRDT
jgi:hypothetical protein